MSAMSVVRPWVFAGLLTFLIGELVTRTLIASPNVARFDPVTGSARLPHARLLHSREGWATNVMNSLGFNDDEPRLKLPAGSRRIWLFGDSYTEALQVSRSLNFSSRLEQRGGCPDVMNFGQAGLAPPIYPDLYDKLPQSIAPDAIVVVVTHGDFRDIERGYLYEVDATSGRMVSVRRKSKGAGDTPGWLQPLKKQSALLNYLAGRLSTILRTQENESAPQDSSFRATEALTDVFSWVFSELGKRAPLYILFLPAMEYRDLSAPRPTADSKAMDAFLAAMAAQHGAAYASATSSLTEAARSSGRPPVGFANLDIWSGHLNPLGHEAVAQTLGELLRPVCAVQGAAASQ